MTRDEGLNFLKQWILNLPCCISPSLLLLEKAAAEALLIF